MFHKCKELSRREFITTGAHTTAGILAGGTLVSCKALESLNLASQGRKIDELHRLGREYEVAQEELQELLDEWTRALA